MAERIPLYLDFDNGEVKEFVPGDSFSRVVGVTSLTVSFVATATISAFDVVTSEGAKGNSATIAQRNKIIGISSDAVASGFAGTAICAGAAINPAWSWAIGDKIFLNGTSLSTTAPGTGYVVMIGTATASDTIDVKISESILL